jgi:hypothetical protein
LVFERFSLPDVARVGRRTMVSALVVAVLVLALALVLDAPLVGLGAVIGIGLGVLNFRMITASVVRVGRQPGSNKRRPLAMNTFTRLGAISVVTLGLLFLSFQLGFGVLGGLALFQVLLLVNTARAMYVAGQQALVGPNQGPAGGAGPDD